MGIFDKVKFWKKEDFTLDMGTPAEQTPQFDPMASMNKQPDPLGAPRSDPFSQPYPQQHDSFGHDVFQQQPAQQYPQQSYPATAPFPGSMQVQQPEQYVEQHVPTQISHRDMELILAKLDAIKSELDSLHQRVRKIEQQTENPSQASQRRYW